MDTKLLEDFIKAKKAEDKAKEKRLSIEAQISEQFPKFTGNSKTEKFDDFKVKKQLNPNWKFLETWEGFRETIPENMRPEKIKYEVDSKGLAFLKENYPDDYKKISEHVEYKENKPTITVEKK